VTYVLTLAVLPYIGVARGARGPGTSKYLKRVVILCFERRYFKQNSVFLPKIKHFGPSQTFGLATLLLPYNIMIYYYKLKANYFHHC